METVFSSVGDHDQAGRFRPGNNARRQQLARIEALMADIASEFEGGLEGMRPSDRLILKKAVTLLCKTPRSHWDEARGINAAGRLLGGLRKRLRPKPSQPRRGPSVSELIGRGNGNG